MEEEEDYENMVVASSSADEMEVKTEKETININVEMEEKQSAVDVPEVDHMQSIDKQPVTDGQSEGGAHMDADEFFERYPSIHSSLEMYYPYRQASCVVRKLIIDCLVFVSPDKLDDLENDFMIFHGDKFVSEQQRLSVNCKMWKLLERIIKAYRA